MPSIFTTEQVAGATYPGTQAGDTLLLFDDSGENNSGRLIIGTTSGTSTNFELNSTGTIVRSALSTHEHHVGEGGLRIGAVNMHADDVQRMKDVAQSKDDIERMISEDAAAQTAGGKGRHFVNTDTDLAAIGTLSVGSIVLDGTELKHPEQDLSLSTLSVSGAVHTDAAVVANSLEGGSATIANGLSAASLAVGTGGATVASHLSVAGAVCAGSTLSVSGGAYADTLTVSKGAVANGALSVGGDVVGSSLSVGGEVVGSLVSVSGDVHATTVFADRISVTNLELSLDDLSFTVPQDNLTVPRTLTVGKNVLVSEALSAASACVDTTLLVKGEATLTDVVITGTATFDNPPTYETLTIASLNVESSTVSSGSFETLTAAAAAVTGRIVADDVVTRALSVAGTGEADTLIATVLSVNDSYVVNEVVHGALSAASTIAIDASLSTVSALSLHGTTIAGSSVRADTLDATQAEVDDLRVGTLTLQSGVVDGALSVAALHTPLPLSSTFSNLIALSNVDAAELRGDTLSVGSLHVQQTTPTLSNLLIESNLTVTKHLQFETASSPQLTALQTTATTAYDRVANLTEGVDAFSNLKTAGLTATGTMHGTALSLSANLNANFIYAKHVEAETIGGVSVSSLGEDEAGNFSVSGNLYVNNSVFVKELLSAGAVAIDDLTTSTMRAETALFANGTLSCGSSAVVAGTLSVANTVGRTLEITEGATLAAATVTTLRGAEVFNEFGSSDGRHTVFDGTLHVDRLDGALLRSEADGSLRVLADLVAHGPNTTVNDIAGETAAFRDVVGGDGAPLAMSKGARIDGELSAHTVFMGEVRLDTLRGRATNSQLNVTGPLSVSQNITLDGNVAAAGTIQGAKASVSDTLTVQGATTLEGGLTMVAHGAEAVIATLSVGTLYTEDGSGLMGMMSESMDLTGTLSVNAVDALTLSVATEHAGAIFVDTITVNTAMNLNGDFVTSAVVGSSGTITGDLIAGSISAPEIVALEAAQLSIERKLLGAESVVAIDATDALTCGGALSVGAGAAVSGDLSVHGALRLNGTLRGEAMFGSTLSVTTLYAGSTTITTPEADLNIPRHLYVSDGYAHIADHVSVPTVYANAVDTTALLASSIVSRSELSVSGLVTFPTLVQANNVEMSRLSVAASAHVGDSVYVANSITLGEHGIVRTKELSLGSLLSVGGLVVNGHVSTTGPVHLNGRLHANEGVVRTDLSVGTTITAAELQTNTVRVEGALSVADGFADQFRALSIAADTVVTTGGVVAAALSVVGDAEVKGAVTIDGACRTNSSLAAATLSIDAAAAIGGVVTAAAAVVETALSVGGDLHVDGDIVSANLSQLATTTSQLRADVDTQADSLSRVLDGSLVATALEVEGAVGAARLNASEINADVLSVNDTIHTQFVYAKLIQADSIVGDVVATLDDGDPSSYIVPNDLFVENGAYVKTALSTGALFTATARALSLHAPAMVAIDMVADNATVNQDLYATRAQIDDATILRAHGPVLFDDEIATSGSLSVSDVLYTTSDELHVVGGAAMHGALSVHGEARVQGGVFAPSAVIDAALSVGSVFAHTLRADDGSELQIASDLRTAGLLTATTGMVVTGGALSAPSSTIGTLSVSALYLESELVAPLPVDSLFSNLKVLSNVVADGLLSVGTVHAEEVRLHPYGEIVASNLSVSEATFSEDVFIGAVSLKDTLLADALVKTELSAFAIHVGSKDAVLEDGVSANSAKLTGNFEIMGDLVTSGSLVVNGVNVLDNIASSTIDTTSAMVFGDSLSVGNRVELFNGGHLRGGLANEVIVYCNLTVANTMHALNDVLVGEGSELYSVTSRLAALETTGGTAADSVQMPANAEFDTVVVDQSLGVGGVGGVSITTNVDGTQLVVDGTINIKGSILQNGAPYEVDSDQFLPLITPRLPIGFRQVFGSFRTGEYTEDVGVILDIGYGANWWNDENKVRIVESTIRYTDLLPIKYDGSLDMDKIENLEEPISYPFEANPSFSVSLRNEDGSTRKPMFGVILGQTEPNNYFMFQDLDPNNARFKENFASSFESYHGVSEGYRVIRDSVYMAHEALHTQGTTFYTLQSIVTRDNTVKVEDLYVDWSATSTEGTSLTYTNESASLYRYAIASTAEGRVSSHYEKQGGAHVLISNSTKMYPSLQVRKWQNDGSHKIYITPTRSVMGWGVPPNPNDLFESQHANGQLRALFDATYYYVYNGTTAISETGLEVFRTKHDLDALYESVVVHAADAGHNLEILKENGLVTGARFRTNIFPSLVLSASIDIENFLAVSRYSVTELGVTFQTVGTAISLYPITVEFVVAHSYILEKYLTYSTSSYDATLLDSLPITTVTTVPHESETNLHISTVSIANIHYIDEDTNASLRMTYQENASKRVRFVTSGETLVSEIVDPSTISVTNIVVKDARGAAITN